MAGLTLVVILLVFLVLNRKVQCLMATVQELHEILDIVAVGVNGLEEAIADLKDQVAAGNGVSQADLDALHAKAVAIGTDIADTSDQG